MSSRLIKLLKYSPLSRFTAGLKGFAPIPSSGELPCEWQEPRRYYHRVGFQFSFHLWVLRNEAFYGGQNANPSTNLLKKVTQLQEDTHRHSWALDMDGPWLCPLTGFVFNPAGSPYPCNFLTRKPGGGDGFVTDNPTMKWVSTGLHGTCSKSQI